MAAILYSAKTNKTARDHEMSVEEMAFIDLLAAGWDRRDAYLVAMRAGETWTPSALDKAAREICARAGAKRRLKELRNVVSNGTVDAEDMTDEEVKDAVSKENMLRDLVYARTKTKRGSKEWLDLNKMIADITRMKNDEIKTEDNTVHFYLPLTCNKCSLYNKYNDNNF